MKVFFKFLVLIVIAGLIFLSDISLNKTINNPCITEGYSFKRFYALDKVLSSTDYKMMSQDNRQTQIYALSKKNSYVSPDHSVPGQKVEAVFTDMTIPPEMGTHMIKGTFFNDDIHDKGLNGTVISKTLAALMFKSTDIIGCSILIDEQRYEIIGIYEELFNPAASICRTGTERVYISINSSLGTGVGVQSIHVLSGPQSSKVPFDLQQSFRWVSSDTTELEGVITQTTPVIRFIFGLTFIAFTLFLIGLVLMRLVEDLRQNLKENYIGAALVNTAVKNLLFVIVLIAAFALVIMIFQNIGFSPFMPVRFKVNENIFDIRFYILEGTKMLQESNKLMYWDERRYLMHTVLLIKGFLLLMQSVVYACILHSSRGLIKNIIHGFKRVKIY